VGLVVATATTPARLALRHSAPLVPVRVERLPGVRFRIHFTAPIAPPPEPMDDRAAARWMTAEFMLRVEDWIRATPGQWLCTRRRCFRPRWGVPA
jgi:KDO2-lipid IV(A) lauroyltransferase